VIVEVEGDSQETEAGRKHDERRDAFLRTQGFEILRFDNGQVVDGADHVFVELELRLRHLLKGYSEDLGS
jgi:very-short-patch-repair endonuclease